MSHPLKISLRPGEKIYLNGAVVSTDRKVTLELLNDVTFLLESHVLQPDEATTPLRQLYFILQVMLMTPGDAEEARAMFRRSLPLMMACFTDGAILASLKQVDRLVSEGQIFDALKVIRSLYRLEAEILEQGKDAIPFKKAVGA